MTSGQPRRRRGVVLTATGRQKLQNAIQAWEEQDNCGDKLTIEALSDHTKLDAGTVAKVLDGEEGVDRRTLERFFQAFNLKLTPDDYGKPIPTSERRPTRETRIDWGEAVDVSIFYGRTAELGTLAQWVVSDHCRLIALLGMGGIGKTSLAAKLGEQIQDEFDYVVWRSLREAPPLKEILTSLIQFLSNQQETEADLPESLGGRITKLVEYLRSHRCLLILDNAESLLQEGQAGVYRKGYEGYGELLKRVGESAHQSCLVVTSREKPRELSAMEGEAFLVRSLQLRGVEDADGQEILRAKGLRLSETNDQRNELIHRCAGNPLALKLVATTIQELFDGDIAEFLSQETIAFEGVRDLLDQHFNRLSDLEKSVMYWLAINREPVSVQELQEDIVPPVTKPRLLEALKGLAERSLVERSSMNFSQHPVVMEYVTEFLVAQIYSEILTGKITLFNSHSLIKATAKEYIRKLQIHSILNSILTRISDPEDNLRKILSELRKKPLNFSGYAAGNLLNLLCQLKINIVDYDFSSLNVWQAYLHHTSLYNINFSNSDLTNSVFIERLGAILSVAISPDGNLLVVGDNLGEIHMWQVLSGEKLFTWQGHASSVWSIAFSSDCKTLITGSDDSLVKLWDAQNGELVKVFQGHIGWVSSVVFSPNGRFIASSSGDRTIRVWNIDSGDCCKVLTGHEEGIHSITFNPDGRIICSGSRDRTIRVWNIDDIPSNPCIAALKGHEGSVYSVAFSQDGYMIASGSADQTIKLWNAQDFDNSRCLITLEGHASKVSAVAFSPSNQILVTGSHDCNIKLWDIQTLNKIHCLQTLNGHTKTIHSIAISCNGSIMASGGEDQTVRVWDIKTRQCIKSLRGYTNAMRSIAFRFDGRILVSGSDDQTVRLWDMETGQCIKTLKGHTDRILSVAFNPAGQIVVSSSRDQTIRLWDIETGQCIKTLKGHTDRVPSVNFCSDSKVLVSGSDDQTVRLWNMETGQCIKILKGHTSRITSVAFNPAGQIVASSSRDQTIRLWDIETGQCIKILKGHIGPVTSLAFNSAGQMVISGGNDQTVRLWDVETGQCIKILKGHTGLITSVAFNFAGQMVISGGNDQTVRLWNVETGQCIKILKGHSNWIRSVVFHPQGKTFASCSQDETIRLWEIKMGTCLRTLRAPRPYDGVNITGVTGLSEAQKESLIALGAFELE